MNDIVKKLNALSSSNLTYTAKPSEISRFSDIPLEKCVIEYSNTRIFENHGIEYFLSQFNGQYPNLNITIACNRKLKVSAVSLQKGDTERDIVLTISSIQVSYNSLIEAKVLAEKLVKCYEETGKIIRFPIGDWRKTLSSEYQKQAKEYGIGRYDGFDHMVACRNEITCLSCNHNWTQINQGNPDSNTFKCKCGSKNLSESRVNYNYRTDNCEKHWGSSSKEELLNQIHVSKIDSLSKKDREEYMKMHGIASEPQPISNKGLETEITKKANQFDSLTYNDLKKLAIEKGYNKTASMKKEKLIQYLSSIES